MYSLLRRILFSLEAERAHGAALGALRAGHRLGVGRLLAGRVPAAPRRVMGIDFPNPVGLAAGLDKNGDYLAALGSLGFGFIELGTVTPLPQPGNPRPRLFRCPEAEAVVNRMGFNNKGVEHLVRQVQRTRYRYPGVLGINIGKNKDTPAERAADDYLTCLRQVYPYADYVTINISSPNTPGLRDLQHGEQLDTLLAELKAEQLELAAQHRRRVPLVVKIAPDMEPSQIDALAEALKTHDIDAVAATNTTSSRVGVEGTRCAEEAGGLSGRPLFESATRVQSRLHERLEGAVPIIGVGGIVRGEDAAAKVRAGASLVQIYTGFLYRGPRLIGEAVRAIAALDEAPTPCQTATDSTK